MYTPCVCIYMHNKTTYMYVCILYHIFGIHSARLNENVIALTGINKVVLYCVVMCCVVLCCVVLCCVVLCCVVLCCIVLYCIVLYCIVLYCIVLYCIVLYCIVLYCIVLSILLTRLFDSIPAVISSVRHVLLSH